MLVAKARSFFGNQSATALMADGKLPFAKPQRYPRTEKPAHAADKCMPDCSETPRRNRHGVPDLGAEAINEPSEERADRSRTPPERQS